MNEDEQAGGAPAAVAERKSPSGLEVGGDSAPARYFIDDQWRNAAQALKAGMDPAFLTPEDKARLRIETDEPAPINVRPPESKADADAAPEQAPVQDPREIVATYLRAAQTIAGEIVQNSDSQLVRRQFAIVRTKTEEALLFALFGDRTG